MQPVKNRQLFALAGAAVAALLVLGIGSTTAYGILFPPVWAERLAFLNSTGQADVVTVYRNATDVSGASLAGFLAGATPALEEQIAADPGYRCVEYAVALHDEAERCGINCSVLGAGGSIASGGVPANALVAFATTDGGPVYVDLTARNVSAADYPGLDFSRVVLARDTWTTAPGSLDAAGASPPMAGSRAAKPVSFAALEAFLAADDTEDRAYDYPNYTCLDFAVGLFNRAEAAGIKCGVVAVGFAGQADGHAFDAFPTTDEGIVYVDSTGINRSERQDGALPTDNVVYLLNGSELGELPLAQAGGRLDYAFYLERRGQIDAYRQQWALYAADVGSYNAQVENHDAQLEANSQYYAAYSQECGQYEAALAAYNQQMTLYNEAVNLSNGGYSVLEIPDPPSNRADLVAWAAKLDAEYAQYMATWNRLESWRQQLNMQKAMLDGRLNTLRNAAESKWITFSPMGIVDDVDIYWG
ncbi:MAG TPA: hypothetical protein VLT35_04715 [Methanocella sp.]|nr:hypothetical protein [Methanocella sp.]